MIFKNLLKKINNFVDRFYLQTESRESAQELKTSKIYYSTIAPVEKEEKGFSIGFFLPKWSKDAI